MHEVVVARTVRTEARSPEWDELPRYAQIGNLACDLDMNELHVDVSSAVTKIYTASVALSRLLHMSYVCNEMGQEFELLIQICVDNVTAITFAVGTVKRGKLRHIDARQGRVQAPQD